MTGACTMANVFGRGYNDSSDSLNRDFKGMYWAGFKGYKSSLSRLDFKVRPRNYKSVGNDKSDESFLQV